MMSVMVYSRLGALLREQNLTVRDLPLQIAQRFGVAVGVRALGRLARADRIRRADLEVAAAAQTLGVSLNEVFAVETASGPTTLNDAVDADGDDMDELLDDDDEDDVLDPAQSRRLQQLFDLRDHRSLSDDELAEQNALIAEWSHRINERTLRSIAAKRGQSLEQTRVEVAADFEHIVAWRRELEADPARLKALVQEAWEQQQRLQASR